MRPNLRRSGTPSTLPLSTITTSLGMEPELRPPAVSRDPRELRQLYCRVQGSHQISRRPGTGRVPPRNERPCACGLPFGVPSPVYAPVGEVEVSAPAGACGGARAEGPTAPELSEESGVAALLLQEPVEPVAEVLVKGHAAQRSQDHVLFDLERRELATEAGQGLQSTIAVALLGRGGGQ